MKLKSTFKQNSLFMQGHFEPIKRKRSTRKRHTGRQKRFGALGKSSTHVLRRDLQNRLDVAIVKKAKLQAELERLSKAQEWSPEIEALRKKAAENRRLIKEIRASLAQLQLKRRQRHR